MSTSVIHNWSALWALHNYKISNLHRDCDLIMILDLGLHDMDSYPDCRVSRFFFFYLFYLIYNHVFIHQKHSIKPLGERAAGVQEKTNYAYSFTFSPS